MRGNRGQVDDATEAPQLHAVRNSARHVNEAIHIGAAHSFHLRVVEVRQVALGKHTGIVDEDVDGAKLAGYAFGHGAHLRGVPDIRLHGERTPRLLVNERHNVLGLGGAAMIVHRDHSSLARQPQCNRATYAAGGARN